MTARDSVVLGSLLGDAHISKQRTPNANSYWSKSQTTRRREYLEWSQDILGCGKITDLMVAAVTGGPKIYPISRLCTPSSVEFAELRRKWYPQDRKRVPRDLVLDPLMIAVWFFDDGTNSKGLDLSIATQSFDLEDRQFLIGLLAGFGIQAGTNKDRVVHIRRESASDFIAMVSPFCLWEFFRHKIIDKTGDRLHTRVSVKERQGIVLLNSQENRLEDIAKETGRSVSVVSTIIRKSLALTSARNNSTGIKGLYWDKKRQQWAAYARKDSRQIFLGRFKDRDDAVKAIDLSK